MVSEREDVAKEVAAKKERLREADQVVSPWKYLDEALGAFVYKVEYEGFMYTMVYRGYGSRTFDRTTPGRKAPSRISWHDMPVEVQERFNNAQRSFLRVADLLEMVRPEVA